MYFEKSVYILKLLIILPVYCLKKKTGTEHRYDIMDEDHEDWGYTNMANIDTLTKVEEMTNRPALLNNEQMRISVIIRVLSVSSNSIQQRSLPGEIQIKMYVISL